MARPNAYDAAADRILATFPTVRVVGREQRGKHRALVLEFDGRQMAVFYPNTPGDKCGARNHVQDIRRVLRQLGAL